jgi:hypothetical protein
MVEHSLEQCIDPSLTQTVWLYDNALEKFPTVLCLFTGLRVGQCCVVNRWSVCRVKFVVECVCRFVEYGVSVQCAVCSVECVVSV